jgi:hypothetical protein
MHYKWSEVCAGETFSIVTMSGTDEQALIEIGYLVNKGDDFPNARFSLVTFRNLDLKARKPLPDKILYQLQIYFYDAAEAAIFKLKYL